MNNQIVNNFRNGGLERIQETGANASNPTVSHFSLAASAHEIQPGEIDTLPVCQGDNPSLSFNVLISCSDTSPTPTAESWDSFRQTFRAPIRVGELSLEAYWIADKEVQKQEKDGPAWMPATLKDPSLGRTGSNIDELHFIVLDIDHGISFEQAKNKVADFAALVHTTYSHRPEDPRLRVVLPLAHPVVAGQVKPLFEFFKSRFDNKLDTSCCEPARLFYLPACPKDAVQHYRCEFTEGRFLEISDAYKERLAKPYSDGVASTVTASVAPVIKKPSMLQICEGERNTKIAQMAGLSIRMQHEPAKTLALCHQMNKVSCKPPLPDKEVDSIVASILKTATRKAGVMASDLKQVIEAMNSKYVWLTGPMAIYRLSDGQYLSKDALRANYANTTVMAPVDGIFKPMTHFDAWLKSVERREFIDVDFVPGAPMVVNNHINLWRAWGATPVAGDTTLWNEMLDYVFGPGSPERKWIEQWFAYPLQHPGKKLNTAVVIWSVIQGVGKSLLAETVGRLYGTHCKTISAQELHNQFNGWANQSLFIIGEENSGNDRRADANKLKQMITGGTLFVNEKFRPAVECKNQMNFIFTSNHPDAFHLETTDRRFFVLSVDKSPLSAEFYDKFVAWRNSESGLAALMHHLLNVDLTGFDPHGHAPVTRAKTEMVEHSKTELERWLNDALTDEYIDGTIGREIVTLDELVSLYHRDTASSRTTTTAMSKALRRIVRYEQSRISARGGRPNVVTIRRHEFWATQDRADWATEFGKLSPVSF